MKVSVTSSYADMKTIVDEFKVGGALRAVFYYVHPGTGLLFESTFVFDDKLLVTGSNLTGAPNQAAFLTDFPGAINVIVPSSAFSI